ncbi:MAG: hypothetical protein GX974_06445, partial [Clostridiales bacterium]|nr:hypothetical protein [Clostridiales bacterium]
MSLDTEKREKRSYGDLGDHVETEYEENFRVISPSRMVAKRFLKSKLSIVGLTMIIFVFLFSFVGPIIINATWKYKETEVFKIERNSDMVSSAEFKGADGKTYTYYDKSQTQVLFKAPPSKDHWLGT